MLQRIKALVTSGVTAMVFAILSAITATTGWLGEVRMVGIYVACALIAIYFLAWAFFLVRDLWRARAMNNGNLRFPVSYLKVDHDWRINEAGDFYGKYSFNCKNVSDSSLAVIPFDEIWINAYEKMDMTTRISSDEKKFTIRENRQSLYAIALKLLSRAADIRAISWSEIVEPPIPPNESIKYEVTISTPGTEKDAFSTEGTLAGIPTNIPTQEAKLSLSAPQGFRFQFLDPIIVFDGSGNRDAQAEERSTKPALNQQRTQVTWELHAPKTARRYLFRYRFEQA